MEINEQANTLFLGDLSIHCTERDVRKLFRSFGAIETIRIKRNSNARTNLCYGFVKFSSKEGAEAAMTQLNGSMFLGRCIRIGWAAAKKCQQATPFDGHVDKIAPKQETAQIHVSFISKQVDALISEATIRNLFATFGRVLDVTIKKSQFDKNLNIQNGYGFVHFPLSTAGLTAAIEAVNSLHQVTIDRVTYDCSISHTLEQQLIAWNIPLPHGHVPTQPPPSHDMTAQATGYYSSFENTQQRQQPLLPYAPLHQPMMMGVTPPLPSGHLEQHHGHQQQEVMQQQSLRIMQHQPIMNGGVPPCINPYYSNNDSGSQQVFLQQPSMYVQQDRAPPSYYHPRHQQQQQQSYPLHHHHAFCEDRLSPSIHSQSFGRPQFLSQYQQPQHPYQQQRSQQQHVDYDLGEFAQLSIASGPPKNNSMSSSDTIQSASSFTSSSGTSSERVLASVSSSFSSFPQVHQSMALSPGSAPSTRKSPQQVSSADLLDAIIDQSLSISEDQVKEE